MSFFKKTGCVFFCGKWTTSVMHEPQTPKDSWGSLLELSIATIQGLNNRALILKYFSSPFL